MSDFDEYGRYEGDEDERRESMRQRRAWRSRVGCACGYPDLPGQCPGASNCPMAQEDEKRLAFVEAHNAILRAAEEVK